MDGTRMFARFACLSPFFTFFRKKPAPERLQNQHFQGFIHIFDTAQWMIRPFLEAPTLTTIFTFVISRFSCILFSTNPRRITIVHYFFQKRVTILSEIPDRSSAFVTFLIGKCNNLRVYQLCQARMYVCLPVVFQVKRNEV